MPKLDQTGPQGQGMQTGRGLGQCVRGVRQGMGCGRGYGRYAGRAYLSKSEEIDEMEDEVKTMEADLKTLRDKIAESKGE